MWVITVYESVEKYRDDRLGQILEGSKISKKWLMKNGGRFYETIGLSYVEYWKTPTAPTKIVNDWNKLVNKRDYRGKFSAVWGNYLVVEKLSSEEWNSLITQRVQAVKNRMMKQINDLEKEKLEYK